MHTLCHTHPLPCTPSVLQRKATDNTDAVGGAAGSGDNCVPERQSKKVGARLGIAAAA